MKLTDAQKKQLITIALTVLVMIVVQVAAVFGFQIALPPATPASEPNEIHMMAAGGAGFACGPAATPCLSSKYGRDLQVYSDAGATLKFSVDGASGLVSHAGFERWIPATGITVTNGAVFTPTASYQPIAAATAVTPTVSTGGNAAGDWLILVNTSASTVTLADSGTLKLAGAWAGGQYDTLRLLFDGTNWLEIGRTDN